MNIYDYIFILWLIIAGGIGFYQGLSAIILRFVLSTVGFAVLPLVEIPMNSIVKSLGGGEYSPLITVFTLILVLMVIVEVVVWVVAKMRDVLMLTLPDRLGGLFVGVLIAFLLGAFATLHLQKSSEGFSRMVQESVSYSTLYEDMQPWLIKFSKPTFESSSSGAVK